MAFVPAKILLSLALIFIVCARSNGKIVYEAEFSDDMRSCKGFHNKDITCDNFKCALIHGNDDDTGSFGLSGDLEIKRSLKEGYSLTLEVWKLLEIGKEFSFATVADICKNIKREDSPWYPLIVMMNVTDCPIPAKVYSISNLFLTLDFAKDILCLEFCGEYEAMLSVLNEKEEQISCYVLGISVIEVETDD